VANDTIVAPVTAPGESAVAVARLSGPDALAVAARHFRGKRSPEQSPSHRILFGQFVGRDGSPMDIVLLSVFRAPRSYTGEDVVEISSHGGAAIPRLIVETLVGAGARPARPGEFTERAFRNGKLDLAQAEAVAALVRARSDRAARAARSTLGGDLSRRVGALDESLVSLLAEVEARIDFPSDVSERLDGAALAARCAAIAGRVGDWVARIPSARRGEEGVRVSLVGRPNVGKSSLLNALVGYDRAIVSDAPGTTRDTVEASVWLEGVELKLTDTAGLRDGRDPLERIGVARARRAIEESDLLVLVMDRSDPRREIAAVEETTPLLLDHPAIVAWNKADLAAPANGDRAGTVSDVPPRWAPGGARLLAEVETVAIRPGGAEPLVGAIRAALPRVLGDAAGDELPTASARQEALLAEAHAALRRAEAGLGEDASYDLIAVDLTDARRALGEVVGRDVDREVVAAIFSRFCIGK
jgi:tRNA modification GTPase